MKVKIFYGDHEDKMNEFMKDKKVVFVKQSLYGKEEGSLIISIWYEEIKESK